MAGGDREESWGGEREGGGTGARGGTGGGGGGAGCRAHTSRAWLQMRSGSAIDDSLPPSREVHIGSSGDQRLGRW